LTLLFALNVKAHTGTKKGRTRVHRGYIAIWRKIQDHKFYRERRTFSKFEAWIDLLMEAQHKKEPEEIIIGMRELTCNYGESLKSLRTWGRRWNWGEAKVKRFLKLLEKMNQIETKSETVTTRIKIINYDSYDPRQNGYETQAKRKRNASETQVTTDKNEKNEKNEKNDNTLVGCPHQGIIDLYHNILPSLPKVKVWSDAKEKILRARWNEDKARQSIEWWETFFKYVSNSDFLTGRTKECFRADLEWLVTKSNFEKIANGRYHRGQQTSGKISPKTAKTIEAGKRWIEDAE